MTESSSVNSGYTSSTSKGSSSITDDAQDSPSNQSPLPLPKPFANTSSTKLSIRKTSSEINSGINSVPTNSALSPEIPSDSPNHHQHRLTTATNSRKRISIEEDFSDSESDSEKNYVKTRQFTKINPSTDCSRVITPPPHLIIPSNQQISTDSHIKLSIYSCLTAGSPILTIEVEKNSKISDIKFGIFNTLKLLPYNQILTHTRNGASIVLDDSAIVSDIIGIPEVPMLFLQVRMGSGLIGKTDASDIIAALQSSIDDELEKMLDFSDASIDNELDENQFNEDSNCESDADDADANNSDELLKIELSFKMDNGATINENQPGDGESDPKTSEYKTMAAEETQKVMLIKAGDEYYVFGGNALAGNFTTRLISNYFRKIGCGISFLPSLDSSPSNETDVIEKGSENLELIEQPLEISSLSLKDDNVAVEEPQKIMPSIPKRLVCFICGLKLRLTNYYNCKCDSNIIYCCKHRYPESHKCNYDWVKEGKEKLIRDNPMISAEKLAKM